ncbi:MAG TPA: chloride channel protein [Kofleriaceae bacterium]|jgi:CIC family chloride channel protein|nr:chloride channel protein [Kofleriaceae bacterium]
MAIAVLVVGAAAATASLGFRVALHEVYRLILGDESVLRGAAALPAWACVVLPAAGAVIAVSIARFGRAGNSGVGGVMEAVTLGRGRISFKASVTRVVACFAAVASAGAIGREGPIIQLGAGIGDAAGRRGGLTEAQARLLIAVGTAAGFAGAYGTPLAAILFVCEVVTISTAVRLVLPAAIAAVLAGIIAGFKPLYAQRIFEMHHVGELAAFAALGVGGGLVGVGFMWLLAGAERAFHKIPGPAPVRAAVGGAIAGAIMIGAPEVAGNGYEAIRDLLDVGAAAGTLALLMLARAAATSSMVASGVPGGVFTPTLFLGASLGRLLALALAGFGLHVDGGTYAVAGMAAATAATTHAPLMASVMLLEITADAALIVPILLAATIATITARSIHRESLYTEELRKRRVIWPSRAPVPVVDVEGGGGI